MVAMVSSGTDRDQSLELDQVVGGDHGGQGAGVQPHLPRVGVRGLGVGHPHTLQHAMVNNVINILNTFYIFTYLCFCVRFPCLVPNDNVAMVLLC